MGTVLVFYFVHQKKTSMETDIQRHEQAETQTEKYTESVLASCHRQQNRRKHHNTLTYISYIHTHKDINRPVGKQIQTNRISPHNLTRARTRTCKHKDTNPYPHTHEHTSESLQDFSPCQPVLFSKNQWGFKIKLRLLTRYHFQKTLSKKYPCFGAQFKNNIFVFICACKQKQRSFFTRKRYRNCKKVRLT